MKYLKLSILIVMLPYILFAKSNQNSRWKKGIVSEEFIYDEAPYNSCHAGTVAETNDGTLVAAWFGGTYERDPDCSIYVSRFINGQWTEGQLIADGVLNDTLRYPTWNPVLFQVPKGELQLYYKVGPNPREWQGWMKTSADGGKTWSAPRSLPQGFVGPVKNKPVLIDQTLFAPTSSEYDGWQVYFEKSDDMGNTWTKTEPLNDGYETIAIQPSILEYPDGRLQILCRSKNRAILQSWSADRGNTWTEMTKTSLPQNNSGTDAVTLENDWQLLVYNHVLPPGDHYKGERSPLNVALSKDGENWFATLVLEDEPEQRFSYPAVIQTSDELVHILYTWKRVKMKHVVIDPSKLKRSKITNGEWPEN